MKVYLSTTSHDLGKARAFMDRVRDRGHTITHDWTVGIEHEPTMNSARLSKRAEQDIQGVLTADVVIVVMQEKMAKQMTGAAIEIGAALAVSRTVIVVEEECRFEHFFVNHPLVHCAVSLETALTALSQWGIDRF